MQPIELDHAHRSALIHRDGGTLEATGPGLAAYSYPEAGRCWTYLHFDPDLPGIFHEDDRFVPRPEGQSAAGRQLVEKAARAIRTSGMPIALIRWEYREADGYLKLEPVDFHLPLPPALAIALDAPRATIEQAKEAHLQGWNLRCNRCGGFGATWIPGERPGWGAAALCGPHARELRAEHDRHDCALETLRAISFEQHRAASGIVRAAL